MSEAESIESVPWHLDLSQHDMEILIRSRLPVPANVDDVVRTFGARLNSEWIQLTRRVSINWFKEYNWVIKFYYNKDTKTIGRIEVRRMSGW